MARKKNKLKSYLDANVVKKQITRPCEDCPFARSALPGWLDGSTPDEYVMLPHAEGVIECHTKLDEGRTPHQCAGAAIYRSNVAKRCRDSIVLRLPRDTDAVFATPVEFLKHHKKE